MQNRISDDGQTETRDEREFGATDILHPRKITAVALSYSPYNMVSRHILIHTAFIKAMLKCEFKGFTMNICFSVNVGLLGFMPCR
jgi:hypothetical protein